jgi:hypothetical protein
MRESKPETKQRQTPLAVFIAVAACCFVPTPGLADGDAAHESVLPGSASHRIVHQGRLRTLAGTEIHPGTPMMLDPEFGGFPFNVQSSDSRKLHVRLLQPLTFEVGSEFRAGSESGVIGLDATLRVPLAGGLSLAGRVEQTHREDHFQSLGSIHCNNGILRSDSYTASGCRFVNQTAAQFDRRTLSMGPQFDLGNFSTSLGWFTSESTYAPGRAAATNPLHATPLIDPVMGPAANALIPGVDSAVFQVGEASGIDLDFQVGFTTDQAGEIRLGLALTRIYGASLENVYDGTASPLQWNVAAPFNTATMGIEWTNGAFSGGLRGYYREPITFLDRSGLDSMGTFDVHFTWRTPWNAHFSVGASNLLNSGTESRAVSDKPAADRFESIYGRIPYVRYQQDL